MPEESRRTYLILFVALALVRGLLYVALIPPWQAPDEPRHFEYVRLLQEKRRLVGWGDVNSALEAEIIASMARFDFWRYGHSDYPLPIDGSLPEHFTQIWTAGTSHQLHQPPLSYIAYLIPLELIGATDTAVQLYLLRLLSVVLGVLVVVTAFITSVALFPGDPWLALAIPTFILFLPVHSFLLASVNNDHLAEFAASLQILILILMFKHGISLRFLLWIPLLLLVALLSKKTSVIMVPVWTVASLLYLRRLQISPRLIAYGSGILVLLVGLAGVVVLTTEMGKYFREWVLYEYLFLPSKQFPFDVRRNYLSPKAIALYRFYSESLFVTFWGAFGWMNVRLSAFWYKALGVVSLLVVLGLGRLAWRARFGEAASLSSWQRQVLLLFATSIPMMTMLMFITVIRKWDLGDPLGAPPARYFYPLIIPLATLFVLGLREWFPDRYQWLCLVAVLGGLLLLDTLSLVNYILPYFYG